MAFDTENIDITGRYIAENAEKPALRTLSRLFLEKGEKR
jgi:hypothetical protein